MTISLNTNDRVLKLYEFLCVVLEAGKCVREICKELFSAITSMGRQCVAYCSKQLLLDLIGH